MPRNDVRLIDDPATLARAARIVRAALARQRAATAQELIRPITAQSEAVA